MQDKKKDTKLSKKSSLDKKAITRHIKKTETVSRRHIKKFFTNRIANVRLAKRQIIIWIVMVGLVIFAGAVQLFVSEQNYITTGPDRGGTYAEGLVGSLETLNPLYVTTEAEIATSRLMFSSLYSYDKVGVLSGDLATNMKINKDGTKYTVSITKNAFWHDDTALTAKDIVFTVELIKNNEVRSPLRASWQDITAREVDDYTVEFSLPTTYAAFSHALTFPIVPHHILSSVEPSSIRESGFSNKPVGSGPFSFRLLQNIDQLNTHKNVQMVANSSYHKGAPMLNRYELHVYDTTQELLGALESREIGAAANVAYGDTSDIDTSVYEIVRVPVYSGVFMLFNTTNDLLKKPEMRSALQLLTETDEVRQQLGLDNRYVLDSPFIKGQANTNGVATVPAPNKKNAHKKLEKLGYKRNKDGIYEKGKSPLTITITTTNNPDFMKSLEVIREQWAKEGIVVTANVIDPSQPNSNFLQTLRLRDYEVLIYELVAGSDPDIYAYWHSSQASEDGYNFTNYANKIADASISGARTRIDSDFRTAKYVSFSKSWVKDVPAVPLYRKSTTYIVNKQIRGFDEAAVLSTVADRYSDVIHWSVNENFVYTTP